jgi:hypothetical protein
MGQDRPDVAQATGGNRFGDPIAHEPDAEPRERPGAATKRIREVSAALMIDGCIRPHPRSATPGLDRQFQVVRAGPIIHVFQSAGRILPIELELHAAFILEEVETRPIRAVEFTAAAIFGGTVKGLYERAVQLPDADAFGRVIELGDPEMAVGRDRHAFGMLQVLFIVRAGKNRSRRADVGEEGAIGGKDLDVMPITVLTNIDVPVRVPLDIARLLQLIGDEFFVGEGRQSRRHAESQESVA